MSEYQYYEFQKIDDCLREKEMRELRAYSTRARITPTSFTNEYDFGSFKGDADAWMEKYFDGFLYLANWGTRELQLAVSAESLPAKTALQYCSSHVASTREKSGKLILTFLSEEEPDEEWLEGEGRLSSLLQIRNEIGRGDLRSLYLGWLMAVQTGELEDSEKEPPVPPNLGKLSGPQTTLMNLFRVDSGLVAIAARNSPRTKDDSISNSELAAWIASLPVKVKDDMLVQLMQHSPAKVGTELQSRFRRQRDRGQSKAKASLRTVAELVSAAKI